MAGPSPAALMLEAVEALLIVADELEDPEKQREVRLHATAKEMAYLVTPSTRTRVRDAARGVRGVSR